ncbi:MAG: FHA domain-containing protein [Rhodocyclaceae bacterium]|nr:FHA domain-containing protein [Rhodocyclaceae bacterium]MCL4680055.1 FHA domain-containing protein [Rhodocyclaceae bacterium]
MDGLVLKEIPLTKERTTIGRKPHNDIQIDNLAISGEHSVIVTILNDSFLEDLNSTNGTYVNGQAIKKHFLQNNDVIELGKYKLKYINETPSQTTAADFEKTMVLRPDLMKKTAEQSAAKAVSVSDTQVGMKAIDTQAGMKPAQSAATAAPAPSPPQAMPTGAIQVLTGANAGKELELTKNLTTLGKPGVQVAVITRRPHGYFITHVEGANFPVVNGATLDAHPRELKDHDVIELAGVKMEFFLKS